MDTETLVIGAGPAGLSAAASLAKLRRPFEILEARDTVGSEWREHYDRLHLHTVSRHSGLAHFPWPKGTAKYPARAALIHYLEEYARTFSLKPHFGQRVARAFHKDGLWHCETNARHWTAKNLVVATGYNRVPNRPEWPGQESFRGRVLHSRGYKSGAAWRGKRALVVGSGNSGGEIVVDLVEHGVTDVCWSVRGPSWVVPRDLLGMPNQVTAIRMSKLPLRVADALSKTILKAVVPDLSPYGITRPTLGPLSMVVKYGRVPILDIGTTKLVLSGRVKVVPGIERFTEDNVVFLDATKRPFDLLVLATGFRAQLADFIEGAEGLLNERGQPKWFGAEASIPGLYFIGFRNPPGGALREMGLEGPRIAASIAAS